MRKKTSSLASARYQLERAILESVLENSHTRADRDDALRFFGGCAFCGGEDVFRDDHLVPVTELGDTVRKNMVPACQRCDDSKGGSDFHQWMRNSTSERSLRSRGKTNDEIEQRIQRIEEWRAGYKPKTRDQLFGENLVTYKIILEKMDSLVAEAQQLVDKVKPKRQKVVPRGSDFGGATQADRIREFVLERYVKPARAQGRKSIKIRAGDVQKEMKPRQQCPNVCQALKGTKLQEAANLRLISVDGPPVGHNTCCTYKLL